MSDLKKAAEAYAKRLSPRPYPNAEFFDLENAFLQGAAWQRGRDIEIAYGECNNDTGNEVADAIRATAFDEGEAK